MASSPASYSGQLRLTPRGRLLLGASALVVALSLISANTALGSGAGAAGAAQSGSGYESITVLPGESLWSIASDIAPGFAAPTGDIVAMIIDINNLDSAELQAGEQLLVPTA